MNQATVRAILVLLATFLFDFLFWEEKMGLNVLLFSLAAVGILLWVFPESRSSRNFLLTAAGTVLAASMVAWHNSGAAKFAFVLSSMCMAGFAQEKDIRFILYAFWQYLRNWRFVPQHFFAALDPVSNTDARGRRSVWRSIRLGIVPLFVASFFYLLYYAANAKFASLSDQFWSRVGAIFSFDISLPHLFFVLFGFFLTGMAIWYKDGGLPAADRAVSDILKHIRPPRKRYHENTAMLGLRQEFRQALILMWMLNVLLFIVNMTDIRYVWFGFDQAAQADLKGYVHQGTYVLIASILLAMGVLFYVFRKNLNFFPDNRSLKTASAIWLLQNAVLALSVGVRNARYIDFHGLAYKRIGVILFLGLVFFGLYTLWNKISRQHSMFWLWRRNGWALYAIIVLNACISWDVFITRYNLSGAPKSSVDVQYMIYTVSDKNLFLLEQHAALLPRLNMYPAMTELDIERGIELKRMDFDRKMQQYSWKSWNGADAENIRQVQ